MVRRVLIGAAAIFVAVVSLAEGHAPPPRGEVIVHRHDCPTARVHACAIATSPPTIYVGPTSSHADYLHEMGHAFDFTVMTDRARAVFSDVIGASSRPWWGGSNPPAEQFAEAWRMCATWRFLPRGPGGWIRGVYDYRPTPDVFNAACNVMAAAAHGAYG